MASGTWITLLVIVVSIVFYEYQHDIVDWSHHVIAALEDVASSPVTDSPHVHRHKHVSSADLPPSPSHPDTSAAPSESSGSSDIRRRKQPEKIKRNDGSDTITTGGKGNTHMPQRSQPQPGNAGTRRDGQAPIDQSKDKGKGKGKDKGKGKGTKKKNQRGEDAYRAYASANAAGADERQRQKTLHLGDLGWDADPRFEREWGRVPRDAPGVDILSSLTQEEFNTKYLSKRPFILRDANRSIEFRSKLYKSKFMKKYGSVTVPVGSQEDLAGGGMAKDKMKLFDYVRAFARDRRERQYRTDTTFFDRNRFFKSCPDLASLVKIPVHPGGTTESIFTIGDSGSGLSFHLHNDAWNEVLVGKKRWALYPMSNATRRGYDPSQSQLRWLKKIYPTVPKGEKPIEFVQQQGDLVYVPEGWLHATVNIGETVAYGVQRHMPAEGSCVWHFIKAGPWDPEGAIKHATAAMSKCGESAGAYNQLGIVYAMAKSKDGKFPNHPRARQAFRRALELNPLHITTYRNLVNSLTTDGGPSAQQEIKEVLKKAKKHGFSKRAVYQS